MKSDVTVGQSTSPSDVFDSVPYTGVELKSDNDMLPDSEKAMPLLFAAPPTVTRW